MKKLVLQLLVGFILGTPFLVGQTKEPSPAEQLQELTTQLQKSPDDQALREKIIALAKTVSPAPAMPDEAERRMARGTEAFKEAKSTADYQAAVKEFQQATLAAPWLGNAYFNLGLAQDKAEDFEGSLRSLKLAQLASPDSKDIKDLYYKVEYKRDKSAEQNSAAAKEAAQQSAEQQRVAAQEASVYRGLDGGVWRSENPGDVSYFMEVHGHEITNLYILDDPHSSTYRLNPQSRNVRNVVYRTTFDSRQFNVDLEVVNKYRGGDDYSNYKITISSDGASITVEDTRSQGPERYIYRRTK